MSTRIDWTGARFSGAEVIDNLRAIGWRVRCACGSVFVVPGSRLRFAKAFADGTRKTPAHLRCVRCTELSRSRAVRRRGGFGAMRSQP